MTAKDPGMWQLDTKVCEGADTVFLTWAERKVSGRGWGPIRWRGRLGLSNVSVSHPCLSPPWVCDDLRPRYVMTTYRIKTRDSGMMTSEL